MKSQNIPKELHHLNELVKEWGINDDCYRDEKIEESTTENLFVFVQTLTEQDLILINKWLSDEKEMALCTNEYINFTCFLMAYDYSKAVIKSRIN
ncbi:hypothetical protein [Lacihabitans sp. CS3-21]|uniref:hypothetical protein n=1 Tax=Lacihabitans sp. CS3-21 TaxID=2487332 RepID=UPI0020CBF8D9|nr:hypothetical protein [Lacihabitans sp. CS3-21]MCP9747159.1 hypothetical protein [Lacihabitans sp. CS3-21]